LALSLLGIIAAGIARASDEARALVTYRSGLIQTVTVTGFGPESGVVPRSHQLEGTGNTGATVRIPLDRIAMSQVLGPKRALVHLLTGDQRLVEMEDSDMFFTDPDGSEEHIPVEKVRMVVFDHR
jgi:hypothetical protein